MRRIGVALSTLGVLDILSVGHAGAASAAGDCMHRFGSQQQVADGGGQQQWTVADLRKSADPAPGYPLDGQLWEASASVTATTGAATPIVPRFNAVNGGDTYPVLWQLASPGACRAQPSLKAKPPRASCTSMSSAPIPSP